LAEEILKIWRDWGGDLDGTPMLAHGDLKISNLRFSKDGEGLALLDLDTMGYLSRDVEMGDAWRSWCNKSAEDAEESEFSLPFFQASAAGYLSICPLTVVEREALPLGVERICVELAARFAADALHESYFGWSSKVAPTRGDHNLMRARGQLSLARSVRAQMGAMESALQSV
jgi:Ser/Thr protein kinase RdoA (MazF antagonist)